jgi:hypothetical protein
MPKAPFSAWASMHYHSPLWLTPPLVPHGCALSLQSFQEDEWRTNPANPTCPTRLTPRPTPPPPLAHTLTPPLVPLACRCFQEDEWMLITLGGVLGFFLGLAQAFALGA